MYDGDSQPHCFQHAELPLALEAEDPSTGLRYLFHRISVLGLTKALMRTRDYLQRVDTPHINKRMRKSSSIFNATLLLMSGDDGNLGGHHAEFITFDPIR